MDKDNEEVSEISDGLKEKLNLKQAWIFKQISSLKSIALIFHDRFNFRRRKGKGLHCHMILELEIPRQSHLEAGRTKTKSRLAVPSCHGRYLTG